MRVEPVVSVVMIVFNGEKYLAEAIGGILAQSFSDFELLIIDDGSTDRTGEILRFFLGRDDRVRVVWRNHEGIAASRNSGWREARGKYIAWNDADDISMPVRLSRQVAYLNDNPRVGVCGSWVETVGNPPVQVWRFPTDDARIRCRMLFTCQLANSSVMMRRELFVRDGLAFNLRMTTAEDYDVWVRASRRTQLANLPEILVKYRKHDTQVTCTSENWQEDAGMVRLSQLERLKLAPTAAEFSVHQALGIRQYQKSKTFVDAVAVWLEKVLVANRVVAYYPEPAFSQLLGDLWFDVCRSSTDLGGWVFLRFGRSRLSQAKKLKVLTRVKFGVFSVLRKE